MPKITSFISLRYILRPGTTAVSSQTPFSRVLSNSHVTQGHVFKLFGGEPVLSIDLDATLWAVKNDEFVDVEWTEP